jgi:Uma2 family endonuclease
MNAALRQDQITAEEYLEGEELSEVKHEYVGGLIYAMAGASRDHNTLALNLASRLRAHLGGGPCRTHIADVKVRLRHLGSDIFYYPDVVVGCDPRDTESLYLEHPKVVVEVLSKATERLDRREKYWAYRSAESLEEYILIAQDKREVTIFRKADNWQPVILTAPESVLELRSLEFSLPLAAVYEGVKV